MIAQIILKPFTVRVHSAIARHPWARLWYLCRALDTTGRGVIVDLPTDLTCELLTIAKSTLYEWLRDGRKQGAFRAFSIRRNRLRIYLGGLIKVCARLGLSSWGTTATVSLVEVNHQLRAIAVGIVTHDLQEKSHFAARRSLKKQESPIYSPPKADKILAVGKRFSEKPARGQTIPFLLHVGDQRAFVSKSFVPFGASQVSIGAELGITARSVQRHQTQLGLERRQLVQAKHAYQMIAIGLEHEAAERWVAEPNLWWQRLDRDNIRLFEPNGISSSRREGGHRVSRQRLFTYFGKTWLYRCNLYAVSYRLNSMQMARHRLKQYLDRLNTRDLPQGAGGERGGEKKGEMPPGKEGQNP